MRAWGRKDDIKSEVANVPEKWLIAFAIRHPEHFIKFPGDNGKGTALYRSAGVLRALEDGEGLMLGPHLVEGHPVEHEGKEVA